MGNAFRCFNGEEEKQQQPIPTEKEAPSKPKKRKILLVGPGEVGRSTLFRQVRFHTGDEVKESDIQRVYCNITNLFVQFANYAKTESVQFTIPENNNYCERLCNSREFFITVTSTHFCSWIYPAALSLMKEPSFSSFWEKRHSYYIPDGMDFLITRLTDPVLGTTHYVCTPEDVVHCYSKTTGTITQEVPLDPSDPSQTVQLVDLGGQRCERHKWPTVFENMTELACVVSLSDYYKVCYEDDSSNRLEEALKIFEEICTRKTFAHCRVYLIFNKMDKFIVELKKRPLGDYFPHYKGGNDVASAVEFITRMFLQRKESFPKSAISVHYISAVNMQAGKWFTDLLRDGIDRNPMFLSSEIQTNMYSIQRRKLTTDIWIITDKAAS